MEPILHEVFAVSATEDENTLIVDVELTDMNGERYRCDYVTRPDDPYGLNPIIQSWLDENEGDYEVIAYVPPTQEVIREQMPVLDRFTFHRKLKAAGISKANIEQAINAIDDDAVQDEMRDFWTDSPQFSRLHPFVLMVAAFKNKTPEQMDAIWRS